MGEGKGMLAGKMLILTEGKIIELKVPVWGVL
jgi:hypothetical protein